MSRTPTSTVPSHDVLRRPLRRVERALRAGLFLLVLVLAAAAVNTGVMLALLMRLPPATRAEERAGAATDAWSAARTAAPATATVHGEKVCGTQRPPPAGSEVAMQVKREGDARRRPRRAAVPRADDSPLPPLVIATEPGF